MARPKNIENPVITDDIVDGFIPMYEELKRDVEKADQEKSAAKSRLNDFRNKYAETTSAFVPAIETSLKITKANQDRKCLLYLLAMIKTFKAQGVFRQGDMFLVQELIEEIRSVEISKAA